MVKSFSELPELYGKSRRWKMLCNLQESLRRLKNNWTLAHNVQALRRSSEGLDLQNNPCTSKISEVTSCFGREDHEIEKRLIQQEHSPEMIRVETKKLFW